MRDAFRGRALDPMVMTLIVILNRNGMRDEKCQGVLPKENVGVKNYKRNISMRMFHEHLTNPILCPLDDSLNLN